MMSMTGMNSDMQEKDNMCREMPDLGNEKIPHSLFNQNAVNQYFSVIAEAFQYPLTMTQEYCRIHYIPLQEEQVHLMIE